MNHLAAPVIYRHVDLSYHNDEGTFMDIYRERMVRADNPNRDMHGLDETMFHKQQLFIDTMIRRPSYRIYVSSLIWTYMWMDDESEADQLRLWKAFQSLVNVTSVDICSMDVQQYYVNPPPLFHSATKIRIGGRMPYALFRGILAFPAKLQSLDIDNVQGWGQVSDRVRLDHISSLYEVRETEDENLVPITRHPGPMIGHLLPLTGCCTKLRYLRITSVGQDDYPDHRWCEKREKARYTEVAKFIESVKPSLERLHLEYGTEPDRPPPMGFRGIEHWKHHVGRPMDRRFIENIIPTLSRGPWPVLISMIIRGIGGTPTQTAIRRLYTPEDDAVFIGAEKGLRSALSKDITVVWERENICGFYLLEAPGSAYDTES
ncbi:uncharacterized protein PAC_03496 [Phialocephala subalpina]|uniref:F-box domain-containing protein n=1 Tax=Phialocephala subalpina TaxID=576137 RepID=A0A1L7WLG7_9HELO|nr:uncharacterized protein PAC_03496 [Phialocephala subalpina]